MYDNGSYAAPQYGLFWVCQVLTPGPVTVVLTVSFSLSPVNDECCTTLDIRALYRRGESPLPQSVSATNSARKICSIPSLITEERKDFYFPISEEVGAFFFFLESGSQT